MGGNVIDPGAIPSYELFVKEALIKRDDVILTVSSAYDNFTRYCQMRGLSAVERRQFKSLIAEVIREKFGMALRRDLKNEQGKYQSAWKNLACRSFEGTKQAEWRN